MEVINRLDMQAILLLQFLGIFLVTVAMGYILIIIWRIIKGGNPWK